MAKTKDSSGKEKMKIQIESDDKDVQVSVNEKKQKSADKGADKAVDKAAGAAAEKAEEKTTENASGKADENVAEKGTAREDANMKAAEENLAAEKEKYLRLAAEYDNFRKRTAKERDMTYGSAKIDVIGKLLPVYDNLERALKMECSDEAFYKGIEMTMLQLTEILKTLGVTPVPTVGEQFDPNLHNAVMRIEDPNLGEGIITEECQKGFALGERIIRFATVVVAN